jgi:hypothetical protein
VIGRAVGALWRGFRELVSHCTRHPLGLVGANLATFAVLAFLFLLALDIVGVEGNPYVGLFAYLILPALFVLGLVLIPIGARLSSRRGGLPRKPLFPVLDLNRPENRQRLTAILLLTAINFLILGLAGFKAVHYMDSSQFCGLVCHKVMQPEYTAYLDSPHARVECVDCHIGPGGDWFVKSKLSGMRQVLAVATNRYDRPIPNPVHDLRPARETCETCHWPQKFHGDRIKVLKHYSPDSANTALTTVLLLKVGGGSLESGFAEGIHWHMNIANKVEYIADSTRSEIYWVSVTDRAGKNTVYQKEGIGFDPLTRAGLERRVMDCMDCHNRPTHTFRMPGDELDRGLTAGLISSELPYIRREAERVLREEYPDQETAKRQIAAELHRFYREGGWTTDPVKLEQAVSTVQAIYARSVFPQMKVTWGTYPNHIGHENSPGCFRCHDEAHVSADGRRISQDCTNCHHLMAVGEEKPEIIDRLYSE